MARPFGQRSNRRIRGAVKTQLAGPHGQQEIRHDRWGNSRWLRQDVRMRLCEPKSNRETMCDPEQLQTLVRFHPSTGLVKLELRLVRVSGVEGDHSAGEEGICGCRMDVHSRGRGGGEGLISALESAQSVSAPCLSQCQRAQGADPPHRVEGALARQSPLEPVPGLLEVAGQEMGTTARDQCHGGE
jgi:hypothetical protein